MKTRKVLFCGFGFLVISFFMVSLSVGEDIEDVVINQIKQDPMVLDAAIVQKSKKDINLALIVSYKTSKGKAKQLGDNFMRLFKSLSDDEPPGKQIGTGIYDYMIGVYYPDKKRLAFGAKVRTSPFISWW